ncbi:unnamed protein product, partial [Iphiclides podalirius]
MNSPPPPPPPPPRPPPRPQGLRIGFNPAGVNRDLQPFAPRCRAIVNTSCLARQRGRILCGFARMSIDAHNNIFSKPSSRMLSTRASGPLRPRPTLPTPIQVRSLQSIRAGGGGGVGGR